MSPSAPGDTPGALTRGDSELEAGREHSGKAWLDTAASQPHRADPLFRDHTAQTHQLDTLTLARPSEGGSMAIFLPILQI